MNNVVLKLEDKNMVKVGTLELGTLFVSGGTVYIKMDPDVFRECWNVVCIEDGEPRYIQPSVLEL